jgi:hypothetical protein
VRKGESEISRRCSTIPDGPSTDRVLWAGLFGIAALNLAAHLLTNSRYGFHRDEFLYLALGEHMAAGYHSVPSGIAVISWISQALLGPSVEALRFTPALAGAALVALTGLTAREFGGGRFAVIMAALATAASPAFLRTGWLFQPVAFNQLWWVVIAFLVARYLNTRDSRLWLWTGLAAGLALHTKYSVLAFLFALFLGLLASRDRSVLADRRVWIGVAVGLLVWSPNLLWQIENGFPVIRHMAELSRTQLVNVKPSEFLLDQVLMNLPGLIVWTSGLGYLLFSRAARPYRALGLSALILITTLLLLSGKSYYTLGVYPILMAGGGVALERWTGRLFARPRLVSVTRCGIAAVTPFILLPILPLSLPVLPIPVLEKYCEALVQEFGLDGPMRWEDGHLYAIPQDYADMLGWDEMTRLTVVAYDLLESEERARLLIFGSNYGTAGAVRHLGRPFGLPEAMSFHDAFFSWLPAELDALSVIVVGNPGGALDSLFSDVSLIGRVTEPLSRSAGAPVTLFRRPTVPFERAWPVLRRTIANEYGHNVND